MIDSEKIAEIEISLGFSLKDKSSSEIKEIADSFDRLCYKYDCPISRLKETFFLSLSSIAAWNPIILSAIKQSRETIEAPKEAKEFGINPRYTTHYIICNWIDERLDKIERDRQFNKHIESVLGQSIEEFVAEADAREENPLSPSLIKGNNLENKIYTIAEDLTNYIEYYFNPLSDDGRKEALIYCCILLIKFRPEHGNNIYLSKLCDRVFSLLLETIYPLPVNDNRFFELFNQRTSAWSNPYYPASSLWRCFYDTPFMDLSECLPDSEFLPIVEIKRFEDVLASMKLRIVGKHGDFKDVPDENSFIRPLRLKQLGLTPLALNNFEFTEPEPKQLIVKKDFSISVDYDGFKCNISLSPVEKALYILYLNHPEGINFKDLADYKEEFSELYRRISKRSDEDLIEKTVDRIMNPFNNSINEKCSRIKKTFEDSLVPEELLHWYIIGGEKGGIRRIELNREMVITNC